MKPTPKKKPYSKPTLTKHKPLRDITAGRPSAGDGGGGQPSMEGRWPMKPTPKKPYTKPTLTKHKPLRDITAGNGSPSVAG